LYSCPGYVYAAKKDIPILVDTSSVAIQIHHEIMLIVYENMMNTTYSELMFGRLSKQLKNNLKQIPEFIIKTIKK
jgi:hypothetical protein